MNRQQLEHIIRAAAAITEQDDLVIIGSQAILGQHPDAPEELLVSREADIYAPDAPERSDYIDGALGPDTLFDKTHGYHADGVSRSTASLPAGWNERLIPICNPNGLDGDGRSALDRAEEDDHPEASAALRAPMQVENPPPRGDRIPSPETNRGTR